MHELVWFSLAALAFYFLMHLYQPTPPPSPTQKVNKEEDNSSSSNNNSYKKNGKTNGKVIKAPADKEVLKRRISLQSMGALALPRSDSITIKRPSNSKSSFPEKFEDSYNSFSALRADLQEERVRVVIGIDFTASNEWNGRLSFDKRSLHKLRSNQALNPYQKVLHLLGQTLGDLFSSIDDIRAFGFGDARTKDREVFSLTSGGRHKSCFDFRQVLVHYNNAVRTVKLGGPTCFAPLIRRTIQRVKDSGRNKFHLLVILADGQLEDQRATLSALADASKYPISVLMVGVGDGPWTDLNDCEDQDEEKEKEKEGLKAKRKFQNYHFVNFYKVCCLQEEGGSLEVEFALAALAEVPAQMSAMKDLGYFSTHMHVNFSD